MNTPSSIATLRTALNADRRALRAAVERVPASLRTVKPAPDRWSVAEVLFGDGTWLLVDPTKDLKDR